MERIAMPLVFGALTFVVTFFLLRRSGGVVRHLLAVLFAGTVAPFLALAYFQMFSRYRGRMSYESPEVWQAMQLATVFNGAAIALGLILGIIVATMVRRKGQAVAR
jgi:hypothetical protein